MQNELRRLNEELALLECTDKPVKRLLANFGNYLLFSIADNGSKNKGKSIEDIVESYRITLRESKEYFEAGDTKQQKLFENGNTDRG